MFSSPLCAASSKKCFCSGQPCSLKRLQMECGWDWTENRMGGNRNRNRNIARGSAGRSSVVSSSNCLLSADLSSRVGPLKISTATAVNLGVLLSVFKCRTIYNVYMYIPWSRLASPICLYSRQYRVLEGLYKCRDAGNNLSVIRLFGRRNLHFTLVTNGIYAKKSPSNKWAVSRF